MFMFKLEQTTWNVGVKEKDVKISAITVSASSNILLNLKNEIFFKVLASPPKSLEMHE